MIRANANCRSALNENCSLSPFSPVNTALVLTETVNNGTFVSFLVQEAGVRRIAVGVGSGVHDHELKEIASDDSDVLHVSSYDDLHNKLEAIMTMACEDQYPGKLTKLTGNRNDIK